MTEEDLFKGLHHLNQADIEPEMWEWWLRNYGPNLVLWAEKAKALEKALRTIVEDEDYGAGGLGCHEDCHTNYARGSEKPVCDCYVKDVMAALETLKT